MTGEGAARGFPTPRRGVHRCAGAGPARRFDMRTAPADAVAVRAMAAP